MKILMLGDVSRTSACIYLKERLGRFIRENGVEFTIVNGENSAENNGINRASAEMLFDAGADVITTGNHAFKSYDAKSLFEDNENILRPANYPGNVPGDGVLLTDIGGINNFTCTIISCTALGVNCAYIGSLINCISSDFSYCNSFANRISSNVGISAGTGAIVKE